MPITEPISNSSFTDEDFDMKCSSLINKIAPAISRELECEELLLKENKSRFVLFPIKYDPMWRMYKKHVASVWIVEEIGTYYIISQFNIINILT